MHEDLRRRALESKKTVSRKARSQQSSAPGSRNGSRTASRIGSRQGSDNEDDALSDGTEWTSNSIDDLLAAESIEGAPDAWIHELGDRMEQIIDRKRSSNDGREQSLAAYNYVLTAHYAMEELHGKLHELYPAMLKSVRTESSEKEVVLALRALALTMITLPTDDFYEAVAQQCKRSISDSGSLTIKAAAIQTLGIAAFYGDASDSEIEEIMEFLLSIVESDGEIVDASDDASVVAAAEETWGFLATQLDDTQDMTEAAMDAFVEQLDSSDPGVSIAAGENIALLFEKSYTPLEDGEEPPPSDSDESEDERVARGETLVKRYDVYRRRDQLLAQLQRLASISGRSISKRDKKSLHANFSDILHSVENPTRGPRYQTAIDQETGRHYGSRMTVRIYDRGEMRLDKWWKLMRLKILRKVLQGGFVVHYESNAVVFDSLPAMMTR